MSERTTHTIYLGDGKRMAVAVADQCKGSNPSLTIDAEGRGVIALVPQTIAPLRVELKLLKEGDTIADVQPTLAWEMVADSIDGEPPYWADGVRIHGTIPMAADWHESRIKAQFDGGLPLLTQNPIPREIPASKSDVLPDDKISVVTTSLVPGERIWAEHDYLLTDSCGTAQQFFRTLSMIGGEVTAKTAHPTISGLFTYSVDAAGTVISGILPSDYYPYDVGDWVYLLTLSGDATTQARDVLQPPDELRGAVRLAPYQINNRGAFPSIKSYLHSEFTRWANLRILIGTVTAIANNRASVLLDETGQTITDVEVRFYCNKQTFEHQHTAIHNGDSVLVAYDGYRSDPGQANCYVIGHTGTVGRCATGGIIARLFRATGAVFGADLESWLFSGNSIVPDSTAAGNCWWTDGTEYISWDVHEAGKYAQEGVVATTVYKDGSAVAYFADGIAAAAFRSYGETTELLIVARDCTVWKKTLFSGAVWAGWTKLRDRGFNDPSYLGIPAVFNRSASECSAIYPMLNPDIIGWDMVYLCTWSIAGDSVTFTMENQAQPLPVAPVSWKKPLAVDYDGDRRIIAYVERRSEILVNEQSEVLPDIRLENMPGSLVLEGDTFDVFSLGISSNQVTRDSAVVVIDDTDHIISSLTTQQIMAGTEYASYFSGYKADTALIGTVTHNYTYSIGAICGMSLPENTVAVHTLAADTFTGRQETTSGTPYDPVTGSFSDQETGDPIPLEKTYAFDTGITVRRTKRLNSSVLLEKSMDCAAQYPASSAHKTTPYLPPISGEAGFDTIGFTAGVGLTWSVPGFYDNHLLHISAEFQQARRDSDLLTLWRLDYNTTHEDYSGGVITSITGLTGQLFSKRVTVV